MEKFKSNYRTLRLSAEITKKILGQNGTKEQNRISNRLPNFSITLSQMLDKYNIEEKEFREIVGIILNTEV